jgi:hypothetical protein
MHIFRKEMTMKIRTLLITVVVAAVWVFFQSTAHSQLGDFFKGAKKVLTGGKLSEDEIAKGLKEALRIGTDKAVEAGSRTDGYYKNPAIKIPLPSEVKKVEKVLKAAGMSQQIDDFELSMNRAAEQAAPEAKNLFWEAIKEMSFSDAKTILTGEDNAATLYFKDKTSSQLQEIFQPIVHRTMGETGVTRSYQELDDKMQTIPFAGSLRFDLDQYVTDQALDGLFFLVSEQEKMIRQDPAARSTDLLKKVFGEN